jgi:hypothetical protein
MTKEPASDLVRACALRRQLGALGVLRCVHDACTLPTMRTGVVSCAWLVTLFGCAGTRPVAAHPDSPPNGSALSGWDGVLPDTPDGGAYIREAERWCVVQFRSAVLRAQRPDGTPWHRSRADNSSVVIGGLFGLALGSPSLGLALGKAMAQPGGDPLAPAPYVILRAGGTTYRISAATRTYSPTWEQPIIVDTSALNGSDQAVVQVMDAIDDSLIGQQQFKVADFFLYGARTLTDLGPVASLDLEVKSHPPRQRQEYDLVVLGDASIQALSAGGVQGWRAIPVWNGDIVTIQASGSVCPSELHPDDCFGPDGAAGRWTSYNYPEFKDVPHASLVALFPGSAHYVGSSRQLRADQSGQIWLFVNDKDTSNNRGAFQVHVTVAPPQ